MLKESLITVVLLRRLTIRPSKVQVFFFKTKTKLQSKEKKEGKKNVPNTREHLRKRNKTRYYNRSTCSALAKYKNSVQVGKGILLVDFLWLATKRPVVGNFCKVEYSSFYHYSW